MSEWTESEAQAVFQQVSKKAQSDAEFRKLALSNPGQAVKQATGKDLPAGFNLRFVDNAGAHLTLVLPDPQAADGELSDADLESVAGGGRCGGSCAASCVVSSS